MAGKGIKNDKQKAAILGSIAGAQHVRLMAKHYGIPVIIHSDHCAKKLLEWFDGMLEADEAYFKVLKKYQMKYNKIWKEINKILMIINKIHINIKN